MRLFKSIHTRQVFGSFTSQIIAGIVAMVLYEHVVTPSKQLLPHVPVFLHNVLATAAALLVLMVLAVGLWLSLTELWNYISMKDLRRELRERIRKWPTTKWDAVNVFAFAGVLAVGTVIAVLSVTVPRGYLAGVVSYQQAQGIGLLMMSPLLAIGFMMIVRSTFSLYGDFRQRLEIGTRKEKVVLYTSMSFVLMAVHATTVGEIAGWSHLLWFYSG